MAGLTAQIVAGEADLHRGGIGPAWMMWLYESQRPMWIFQPFTGPMGGINEEPDPIRTNWIPSGPEHIVEDGLALLALHGLKDARVRKVAEKLPELLEPRILYDSPPVKLTEMPEEPLLALRIASSIADWERMKLGVTVFGDCAISGQLPVFERYPMDVEVCTVTYSRLLPLGWQSEGVESRERGSLKASWGGDDPPRDRYYEVN